jgi:hypothetical protein
MEKVPKTVNRRRLLRRAGTVAAGLGAAGVASAVAAGPASANGGDPVLAGEATDAGNATTTINTFSSGPTLSLANPALAGTPSGGQLQLVPSGSLLPRTVTFAPAGTLNAHVGGDLEYQWDPNSPPALLYGSMNATVTWPVAPFRALDTRGLGGIGGTGKEYILNPGILNANGTIPAGQTLLLNLTAFVHFGYAVIGNATMQGPAQNGFVTIWPAGLGRPTASTLNFLAGWSVSNAAVVALGETGAGPTQTDVIQIFTTTTTHFIFDVSGFIVPAIGNINPAVRAIGTSPGAASRAEKARTDQRTW